MTLRQYLILMALGTLLCIGAWIFVLMNINPFATPLSGFLFFYATFFASLVGALSLVMFALYRNFSRDSVPMYYHVERSFRDGVLFAAGLTLLLFFQGKGWLTPVNTLIFCIALLLVAVISWTLAARARYH